jgi:DNA repair protein RecN (Recombination protein N)
VIRELRISGLGVIDAAALDLGPGLTVLTGETGAGKTMVLTALALLRGDKADAGAVRVGTERAEVEGRFAVSPASAVAARLDEAGGVLDDDELILGRTVTSEGRSRAFAGGRSVPASVLVDITDELVAVHGQGDQTRLTKPSAQRSALDRFAGVEQQAVLAAHRADLISLRAVERELAELVSAARERTQERDLLIFGLEEIEAVAPQAGEENELDGESGRLTHAEVLRELVDGARQAMSGDDADDTDVLSLLAGAQKRLARAAEFDATMSKHTARLGEVAALAADVAADLASYVTDIDTDPARLGAVEDRRAELSRLTRKYGDTTYAVLEWSKNASVRLLELEGDDERVPALQADAALLRTRLTQSAALLHANRLTAAAQFATAVTTELTALAMPNAVLDVVVLPQPGTGPDAFEVELVDVGVGHFKIGVDGLDDVELRLRPHSGAESRPIAKAASGGELSRVMLALEVVLAGTDAVPTFVFDEVDAGVGGRAATEVGRRLAHLARTSQVLVVTHLPQVAAFADSHLVVEKVDDGVTTRTTVTTLSAEARRLELARMLAGLADSDAATTHAAELLELATPDRALTTKRRTR